MAEMISVTLCLLAVFALVLPSNVDEQTFYELCNAICSCSEDSTVVDCSGSGVSESPAEWPHKILNLNLSDNYINVFPTNFNNHSNLNKLDISKNNIRVVPSNALERLGNLEWLSLAQNSIEAWENLNPDSLFLNTPKLKYLDLSKNKLGVIKTSTDLLVSSSLEHLVLNDCEISSISDKSIIAGLSNIKILKIENNPLKRIHNFVSPSLRYLDVSNCDLSYLYQNTLQGLPSLTHLIMSDNKRLVLTTSTTAVTSESLRVLQASRCNMVDMGINGFPNLRKAVLNNNLISFTNEKPLSLSHLEYLDLSYNTITSVSLETFKGLPNLNHLDLSWNQIGHIPDGTLATMPYLTFLNLSRNYLTVVGNLKSSSLTTLDLSQCEISYIQKYSLINLDSLTDLNLARNLLTRIPDSLASNSLRHLNLNFNRISSINNYTFFMLPKLTTLSVIGNRFTDIWNKSYFNANIMLENIYLYDNIWKCDCYDGNMYDFFEYLTLEPNKKEKSTNLICSSSSNERITWFEECYLVWYPSNDSVNSSGLAWFLMTMIIGLLLCFFIVVTIRRSMKKRLIEIQQERARQVEEARERLRQIRIQAEQEALCNAPDPRDLISPPTYDEALLMPKMSSCYSLNETGSTKSRKRKTRRKTKSSGDLLDETDRVGHLNLDDDTDPSDLPVEDHRRRRRRRSRRYGSHEIAELDHSPGTRRRSMSYNVEQRTTGSTTIHVVADLEMPRSADTNNSND